MHFFLALASSVLVFGSSANAVAIPKSSASGLLARAFTSQPDDPSMTPVDVRDLASDATMTCGSETFSQHDIYLAVQWSTILEMENKGRGKNSKEFPNGRFPHDYTAETFTFNGNCPADSNRQEYPLIFDGPYNGGPRNNKWGDHRVVHYSKDEGAPDGNPIVYFCGGITHQGAEQGKFQQCTVN